MKNITILLIVLILIFTRGYQRDDTTKLDCAKTKGILFLGVDDSSSYCFDEEILREEKTSGLAIGIWKYIITLVVVC